MRMMSPLRTLAPSLSGGSTVSPASAHDDYGVVLTADGRHVDEAATAARRADRPPVKAFHRGAYRGQMD